MPRTTESIQVVGNPEGQTDGTECRDDLEQDSVQAEAGGWDCECRALYDADEKEADTNPPRVRGELLLQVGLNILADTPGKFTVMMLTPMYVRSDSFSSSTNSGFSTPSDLSSYTFDDLIEMMIGSPDIYIAPVYNVNRAGAISVILTMYKPDVRTPGAWNSPEIVRFPGGIPVMVG